jgi:serine/threonine-protein phosphatase 2B catalytic subunit
MKSKMGFIGKLMKM